MSLKSLFCSLFVLSFVCLSCKNELQPQEDSGATAVTAADAPATAAPATPNVAPNPTEQPAQATTQKTAPGMNPPHGQPNHRCDIEVGAPLNSPVKNTPQVATTPSVSPSQKITTSPAPTAPKSTPTVTAPGMNPPHGEEGHRCDVAVGAPLP